ncbi:MAG: glycosyltransferase family 4 protein, partial [Candidatus Omnitrophica bacterium]|nr:glycosyltransferase family 4 protein [Candidatus Omnitrophota bacterium]
FYLKSPFGFLNIFVNFINLYFLDRLYFQIAKNIDLKNYDLVLSHASYFDFIHAPAILRYLSTRCIYYCQEPFSRCFEKDPFSKFHSNNPLYLIGYKLYRFLFYKYDYFNVRHADLVLCNSYYTKEHIYKEYMISSKVNYLGVDIERFRPLDLERENLVLSIGHLDYRKGHHLAIEALGEIPFDLRPRLIIISPLSKDGPYKQYLEHLARIKGVEISFYKDLVDDELIFLYNKAKLTVCAYIKEPFGLVCLESLACSTPVVAVEGGGLKEIIINNENGILVRADVKEIASAIEYLLKNESIRKIMGDKARSYIIERWGWQRSAKELEENLSGLLKNRL